MNGQYRRLIKSKYQIAAVKGMLQQQATSLSRASAIGSTRHNHPRFMLAGATTLLALAYCSKLGLQYAYADDGEAEQPAEPLPTQPEEPETAPEQDDSSLLVRVKGYDQVTQLLDRLSNKFIFLKHGFEQEPHLQAVEELAQTLLRLGKLEMQVYQIDYTDEDSKRAILDFFKNKGATFDDAMIKQNSFILTNTSNDSWLQEFNMVSLF